MGAAVGFPVGAVGAAVGSGIGVGVGSWLIVGEDVGIGDGRAVGSGVGRPYCVLVKVELMQMLKPSSVVVESVKNDIDVFGVTCHPCGPRYPQKVTSSTVRPSYGQCVDKELWI